MSSLLGEEVTRHVPPPLVDLPLSGRVKARQYLRAVLRESGLLYGTPRGALPEAGKAAEEVLFLAVLRTLVRIALDIAALEEAPPGPRREQVLLLLAATTGQLREAAEIDRQIVELREWPLHRKLWAKVESSLEQRAMSLSGDPYYGLVLHNGAVYADAQVFGRQAIDYFARASLPIEAAKRRVEFAARQKALLVEVLTGLACAERPPSFPSRRAILRQIEDLGLPSSLAATLRARVKETFERRPRLQAVVKGVRSADMRRFILEQTILASLVDGQRSPREIAFLRELTGALGSNAEELSRVEVQMAEFYAKNRKVVDVFTVSAGADVLGEELVDSMQRTLEKNFQRLMTEVRETGELSVLLSRAARGHTLTPDERRRLRDQLIDIAKAIPALAIFAAPGGILLLIALAKVLPFSILPSAFHEAPGEEPPEPPEPG
ncbi:MAG: hypothetical protein ACYC8T_31550 [Myxococcaceae bacterium]